MKRLKEIELTDYEIAKYLKENGWVGKVVKSGDISSFLGGAGEVIANIIYNNEKSTRRIFI